MDDFQPYLVVTPYSVATYWYENNATEHAQSSKGKLYVRTCAISQYELLADYSK